MSEPYFVCMRVEDGEAPVPSEKLKCCKCGKEVWASKLVLKENPVLRKVPCICVQCVGENLKSRGRGG